MGLENQSSPKTCFIIMPISTPENLIAQYKGDKDHFLHVLEHLFIPAIDQAGMKSIRPIAEGADLIQAEIVKNLEEAHLVLCDMTSLNANVCFELGVRTALDKPVCLVKDDVTAKLPFDTSIINHHVYQSELAPWSLTAQIAGLAEHVKASVDRSDSRNQMWKYFGLSSRATRPASSAEDWKEYIALEISALRQGFEQIRDASLLGNIFVKPTGLGVAKEEGPLTRKAIEERIVAYAQNRGIPLISASAPQGLPNIHLLVRGSITDDQKLVLSRWAAMHDLVVGTVHSITS